MSTILTEYVFIAEVGLLNGTIGFDVAELRLNELLDDIKKYYSNPEYNIKVDEKGFHIIQT